MSFAITEPSIYGRILSEDDVEDAVMRTLQLWMPAELAEVEDQHHLVRGYYQRPQSWVVRNDVEDWPEDMLPRVIVVSVGISDQPTRGGDRKYTAIFDIGVATIAASNQQDDARRYAYRLGAAARASLIHHQSLNNALDGTVLGVDLLGSTNDDLPTEMSRTLWTVRQLFSVEVEDVLTMSAGPPGPNATPPIVPETDPAVPEPAPPPPEDWPTVPDRGHVRTTIIPTSGGFE